MKIKRNNYLFNENCYLDNSTFEIWMIAESIHWACGQAYVWKMDKDHY